jgi:hypothetical protein
MDAAEPPRKRELDTALGRDTLDGLLSFMPSSNVRKWHVSRKKLDKYVPELDFFEMGTENAKTLKNAVDMTIRKPAVFPPTNPNG